MLPASRIERILQMCEEKKTATEKKSFWETKKKTNWFCNRAPSPKIMEEEIPSTPEDPYHTSGSDDSTYYPTDNESEFRDDSSGTPGAAKTKIRPRIFNDNGNLSQESIDYVNPELSNKRKCFVELSPLKTEDVYNFNENSCSAIENSFFSTGVISGFHKSENKIKIIENTIISHPKLDNANGNDTSKILFHVQTNNNSGNTNSNKTTEVKNITNIKSLAQELKTKAKNKSSKKVVICYYCQEDVVSKNFMRHLQRHHSSEKEVINILKLDKSTQDRRRALAALRNEANFELYISGTSRPFRTPACQPENTEFYPCSYCKCVLRKSYLKRHAKICNAKKLNPSVGTQGRKDHLSYSQTIISCAADPTNTISQMNVKQQVFDNMRGDEISFVAKTDLLIVHFGDSYLKKHRRERLTYVCSNRMRELARLLIRYRQIVGVPNVPLKELVHAKNFENVVSAARNLVGYDPIKKTFQIPSLAMHLGTSLKIICDELVHLILKEARGFKCDNKEEWLKDIKNFKKLVECRWHIEMASLAHKDMNEKRWNKPLLLPLIDDIKLFRDESLKMANECKEKFLLGTDDRNTYKLMVNVTLALLILFNRRRIGDVQFLKIVDYNSSNQNNFADFESALSETERMLTKQYKRVLNSGKGSREVVILIPKMLETFINTLLKNRYKYIPADNDYVFAMPNSKIKWGKGDVAIRTLTKKMKLQQPNSISSNKLRKQIATVMQLINLTKEDEKQFSKFMGHTHKTHEEFYELPADVYQTAKVSKILLLMEKGELPSTYKGKSLTDITFDENLELAIESDNDDAGVFESKITHHRKTSDNNEVDTPTTTTTTLENIGIFKTEKLADSDIEKKGVKKRRVNQNTVCQKLEKCDSENEEISSKGKRKSAWTQKEIALLEKEFQSFIRKGKYPSGKEIKIFLERVKWTRSVAVVKAKLQHLRQLS